ncbi:MAG: hypothetical protein NC114_10455 [Ruminococcus flavefaciens]|nr:hypothetical protein [Ruminococcus flavefaciens]
MKISILYGMPVQSTAGKTGYVISVNESLGKIQCLVCADENENEFAIDVKNIISVNDKVTFEDRESVIKHSTPVRLGKPVYSGEGKFLGHLTDLNVESNEVVSAQVGKKKFSAGNFVCGDAVIVKKFERVLKSDVKKDGRVILRRGTSLTPEVLEKAQEEGEYIQANLKSF